jgi:group I intron endonuclease
VNLGVRLRKYYNHYYLTKGSKGMYISRALLKYGYSGFKLEILEYCAPEKCLEREQYYLDLLNPEYNVLLTAGSPRGRKHTDKARKLMSEAKKGNINAKGYIHSVESRTKISEAKKGQERPEGAGRKRVPIEILDLETGLTQHYTSLRDVCRDIGVHPGSLSNYLSSPSSNDSSSKSKKPFKGRYIFKKN